MIWRPERRYTLRARSSALEKIDSGAIRAKFGINQRFTAEIAERFRNWRVLETCTGGGFTSIALLPLFWRPRRFVGRDGIARLRMPFWAAPGHGTRRQDRVRSLPTPQCRSKSLDSRFIAPSEAMLGLFLSVSAASSPRFADRHRGPEAARRAPLYLVLDPGERVHWPGGHLCGTIKTRAPSGAIF